MVLTNHINTNDIINYISSLELLSSEELAQGIPKAPPIEMAAENSSSSMGIVNAISVISSKLSVI